MTTCRTGLLRARQGLTFGGVDDPTPLSSVRPRPLLLRRAASHALGIVVAAIVTWLILRGYRQPEFLLDLANMRLC